MPPKLWDVFTGEARYRGAYGGRGSGKTRSFAKMAAIRGMDLAQQGKEGIILCGREFMNSLDESTMSEIKAAIASEQWLSDMYEVGERFIRTKDKRIEFKFAGLRHNLDSIKSKSQIHLMWVDEAEPVSDSAWVKIIPTVREHGSEIWVTWNPERKNSATHKRFRADPPEGAKIVEMNFRDNPWFPDVLEAERQNDMTRRAEQYSHIWEGDFITVVEGAYWAKDLVKCKDEGRIGKVAADPLMETRAYFDIGGTGAKADAVSIWMVQFIDKEVRVVNHYSAIGQPLSAHVGWLRDNGYGKCHIVLPHDGDTNDKVYDVSYNSYLTDAGFEVTVIPNQGKGAASKRVEAVRRLFPQIWFNEATTEAGRDSLGWYHEKKHSEFGHGMGPEHDWASHDADAFGLMAIAHEQHDTGTKYVSNFKPRSVI